jgi:hypothetical protein
MATEEEMNAQALALRELAMAQQRKLDGIAGDFATVKKGVVVGLETSGTPAVTINLSGDETTIPGVHYLETYSPAVGDIILLLKQGAELLALGTVADAFSEAGWSTAQLGSGYSHDLTGATGSGPVQYRRVWDHGSLKMQWKGVAARATSADLVCEVLPLGYRPANKKILVCARDVDSAANAMKMEFQVNGTVTTLGAAVRTGNGGTTISNNQSDSSANHNGFSHFHASSQHDHNIGGEALWISFDGLEYFLD